LRAFLCNVKNYEANHLRDKPIAQPIPKYTATR